MIDLVFMTCGQHSVICILLGTKDPFLLNCYCSNFLPGMLCPPVRPIILNLLFKVVPSVKVMGRDVAITWLFLNN